MPGLGHAVVDRRVGDQLDHFHAAEGLLRQQQARPRVPGHGVEVRLVVLDEAALALDHDVAAELVLEVFARRAVRGPEVAHVGHVVEHFDIVDVDLPEVVEFPVHAARVVPHLQVRRLEFGFAPLGVEPHHHAAHHVAHRVGADRGRFRAGALVVGDVVDVAIRTVTPGVVGAADRVALDLLAVAYDHRAVSGREVRAHVRAVGVEHHGATALATVEREIAPEESHRHRAGVEFALLGHDEPAAREGLRAEPVFCCFCHDRCPRCPESIICAWRQRYTAGAPCP